MVPLLVDVTLKHVPSEDDWLGILGPLSPFGEANPYPRVLLQAVSLGQTKTRSGPLVLTLEDGTRLDLQGKWGENGKTVHLGNAVLEARLVRKRRLRQVEFFLKDFRPSLEADGVPSS
jgi:hypothetical protein